MTDSIQPHEPPIKLSTATDTQVAIRTAFSGWVGESLPSLAFGFIWLYLLFGFAHLFTLPAPARWIMSTTALGTMAVMGGLRWFWERNPAKGEWAHAGAALLAGLVGVNSVMHLFLTGDVLQSTNLMLLVVGIGFFFLSSIWFIGALLVVYGCWWLAILTINVESGIWIHFTFGLLSASLLSTLAHIARKRTLRRVTLLRLSDEQRAKQLQDALFAEQAVEEALRQSEMRYRLLYAEVEQRAQELDIANTQLAQAARLKNEFLASVSHELRTPLTAILGLTQSLQEDVYGPLNGLQQNVLRNIDQSGHHLLALITDILDVAKIEAGRFSLDLGPAAVDAVCQSSLLLMKQKAEQKQLTVTVDFDAAVKIIEADERRLKQILVNLLDNAVKFTPQKGAIGLTVSGDTAERVVRLSVWDTGIGIAHQDFARLFKPFVQLDSSLAREYAGSGLGLVLVYRMAEMHGGGVTVESEVGQGSRFTVSLPWRTPTTGAVSVMPLPDDADFGQPQRNAPAASLPLVLIADDQELVTTSLVPMLTSAGVRTVVAQNGLDAIEKARTLRPALLLIDMQLPPMESKEILTALRNEVELATTPIIAISALNWPGQTEQYLADGATAHLCKPVGVKQLRDLLQAWLPR